LDDRRRGGFVRRGSARGVLVGLREDRGDLLAQEADLALDLAIDPGPERERQKPSRRGESAQDSLDDGEEFLHHVGYGLKGSWFVHGRYIARRRVGHNTEDPVWTDRAGIFEGEAR
jgi:hypothetical protein